MKAVILLPTYNERENVTSMLTLLTDVTRKIPGYTFSILVVDDNSPDGTPLEVAKFQKTHPNVFLLGGKKEGLGRALLRGMKYAVEKMGAQVIGQIDADGSHDPRVLPKFFEKMKGGADFVVGSRYIPGGSIPENWGIHRKIYSVVGNAIVRFGLGFPKIHDWTGGYRVFKKKYYEMAREKVSKYGGYVFQIALLYHSVLNGATIGEVPIKFTDRRFGHSKIAPLQYIMNVYMFIARARLKRMVHGSFGKFAVVGGVGFIINTIVLELLVGRGFHPATGSAFGAECAIISNFFLNNAWTFSGRRVHGLRLIPKLLQFNVTSLGAILIQAGIVWIGTHLTSVDHYRWFYILGVGFGLLWNYTMYSKVIWKHPKP